MDGTPSTSSWRTVAAAGVILATGAAAYFVLGGRVGRRADIAPPDDALRLRRTDPKLIEYEEAAGIDTGMKDPRGIAVDEQDRVYVVGDGVVRAFEPSGAKVLEFPTAGRGTCIAVAWKDRDAAFGSHRHIFVGAGNQVEQYDSGGGRRAVWSAFDPNSLFSSIAVEMIEMGKPIGFFLADEHAAEVLHCDMDGNIVGRIGRRGDPNAMILLRSPHFDVALGGDGLLWITNPGRYRVEAYTRDGDREVSWGAPTAEIVGFSGCCNPKDLAFLPDGGIVTSEKGIPRVKVYERDGKLRCVVAGAESFDTGVQCLDLAADRAGRVLVLDPGQKKVRIFVRKKQE